MMKQIFCIVCDSFYFSGKLLCSDCYNKVLSRKTKWHMRHEEGVPHYYLFQWNDRTDTFCRRIAYHLKNRPIEYFKFWSGLLEEALQRDRVCKEHLLISKVQTAVVPGSPVSIWNRRTNHAKSWAMALQKLFKFESVIDVAAKNLKAQKLQSRSERLSGLEELKNTKKEVVFKFKLTSGWVFIDDVFVTGGTYKKVKIKTGSSPEFICTLFYRPYNSEGDHDESVF